MGEITPDNPLVLLGKRKITSKEEFKKETGKDFDNFLSKEIEIEAKAINFPRDAEP